MNTCVEFTSDIFRPVLSEDAQVSPQVYGAELAWWLCQELAKIGIETTYPNIEDWGWFIEYVVEDNEYWRCCGNDPDGVDRRRIYLSPRAKGIFGRNKAPTEAASALLEGVASVLEENQSISGITWSADYA
ncbi:hypothetical protein E4634_19855 [Mangrovimicrobium sediminis]|uniref:Uncharacterized protein n=1 Tax=Mangrovimicrobium sediminis TaxID=2562682 RepID=A0A4Z0LUY5_9GAMM|nr:hypothetical protein [Haliea sp. SAOS-164]TGD71101.1 hypothetical protein E4634_19855 [Haliea sp. SAOS-164]